MKTHDQLRQAVIFGFWVSLLLFLTFLFLESWISSSIQMLIGTISLVLLFLLNTTTVLYYQTAEPSLRSPLFLALILNMTIVGIGFMFVGRILPFTLEDLILFILAIERGEINLSMGHWYTVTKLAQLTCLLAGVGATTDFFIIVWRTCLQEAAAKYLQK
jgi:hypothetical protein